MMHSLPQRWIQIGGAILLLIAGLLLPWRQAALDLVATCVWTFDAPLEKPLLAGIRDPGYLAGWLTGAAFRGLGWFGVALLGAVTVAGAWWMATAAPPRKRISWPVLIPWAAALSVGEIAWIDTGFSFALLSVLAAIALARRRQKLAPLWFGLAAVAAVNSAPAPAIWLVAGGILWWSAQRRLTPAAQLATAAAALAALFLHPGGFPAPAGHGPIPIGAIPATGLTLTCLLALVPLLSSNRRLRPGWLAALVLFAGVAFWLDARFWWPFALAAGRWCAVFLPAAKIRFSARAKVILNWAAVLAVVVLAADMKWRVMSSWRLRGASWAGVIPPFWTKSLASVLQEGPLYSTPAGRSPLVLEKLMPPQLAGDTGMMEDYRIAQQNPALWRQIDRRLRFGGVFLYGDISNYRPLLAHLVTSSDWRCLHFDHEAFVFIRRPSQSVDLAKVDVAKLNMQEFPVRARVQFLSQIATRLVECNQRQAAKEYLDEALKLDPDSPTALAAAGFERISAQDWAGALTFLDRALNAEPGSTQVLSMKIRVLLQLGRSKEAYYLSDALVQLRPDDPSALFLRARACQEIKAYEAQIEVLQRLVRLADRAQYPAAAYRIYLGQAYAFQGQAGPALKTFREALENPVGLSEDEIDFLLEAIDRIEKKTGTQARPPRNEPLPLAPSPTPAADSAPSPEQAPQ